MYYFLQITYTIAKTYQPLKPGTLLSFQNSALGSIGELFIIIICILKEIKFGETYYIPFNYMN